MAHTTAESFGLRVPVNVCCFTLTESSLKEKDAESSPSLRRAGLIALFFLVRVFRRLPEGPCTNRERLKLAETMGLGIPQ